MGFGILIACCVIFRYFGFRMVMMCPVEIYTMCLINEFYNINHFRLLCLSHFHLFVCGYTYRNIIVYMLRSSPEGCPDD